MTLIVAIPAQDGMIFGSDSQVTIGPVRSTSTKIFRLNEHTLWGASGELALIQRVQEYIDSFPNKDQPLDTIRDSLAQFVRDAVTTLLNMDFRTQFFRGSPESLLTLHQGDFLFVEYRDKPRILHVLVDGTSEWWVEKRCAATGNGDIFAYALLQKYSAATLTREHAKLIAYKVIEEAIQVGAYGLDFPIDVWELRPEGVRQASERERAALADAANALRKLEVALITAPEETLRRLFNL